MACGRSPHCCVYVGIGLIRRGAVRRLMATLQLWDIELGDYVVGHMIRKLKYATKIVEHKSSVLSFIVSLM
jgi:hypothetical protein